VYNICNDPDEQHVQFSVLLPYVFNQVLDRARVIMCHINNEVT